MPMTTPAASALSEATSRPIDCADVAHERRDGQRGEEAVDHGRDAGQDLEQRLDDARARAASRIRPGRSPTSGRSARRPAWRSAVMSSVPANSGTAPKAPERADLVRAHRRLRAPLQAEQELADRHRAGRSAAIRTAATARCRWWSGSRQRGADDQRDRDHALDPVAGAAARARCGAGPIARPRDRREQRRRPAAPDRRCSRSAGGMLGGRDDRRVGRRRRAAASARLRTSSRTGRACIVGRPADAGRNVAEHVRASTICGSTMQPERRSSASAGTRTRARHRARDSSAANAAAAALPPTVATARCGRDR